MLKPIYYFLNINLLERCTLTMKNWGTTNIMKYNVWALFFWPQTPDRKHTIFRLFIRSWQLEKWHKKVTDFPFLYIHLSSVSGKQNCFSQIVLSLFGCWILWLKNWSCKKCKKYQCSMSFSNSFTECKINWNSSQIAPLNTSISQNFQYERGNPPLMLSPWGILTVSIQFNSIQFNSIELYLSQTRAIKKRGSNTTSKIYNTNLQNGRRRRTIQKTV